MSKVYITIGLPGSGKSTLTRWMCDNDPNLLAVNKDALRTMIFGGMYKYDPIFEPIVKETSVLCALHILHAGYDVILDETFLSKARRVWWVSFFKDRGFKTTYLHCTEMTYNVRNRMHGGGRGYSAEHWRRVIDELGVTYEPPTMDEGCEEIQIHAMPILEVPDVHP